LNESTLISQKDIKQNEISITPVKLNIVAVSASSTYSPYNVEYIIDGKDDTFWASSLCTPNNKEQFIILKKNSIESAKMLKLKCRFHVDAVKVFSLQISDSQLGPWVNLLFRKTAEYVGEWQSFTLYESNKQFLKLELLENWGQDSPVGCRYVIIGVELYTW